MSHHDGCALPHHVGRRAHASGQRGGRGGGRAFPRPYGGIRAGRGVPAARAGRWMMTAADGATTAFASDSKQRWIDHVTIGPSRAVAWSAGKHAYVRIGESGEAMLELSFTVGAMAFAHK